MFRVKAVSKFYAQFEPIVWDRRKSLGAEMDHKLCQALTVKVHWNGAADFLEFLRFLLCLIALGPLSRSLASALSATHMLPANAQLTATIADEVAHREKMSRELEIAREVQERLFPQRFPPVMGLDYSGQCRTALGVGGDYYDFLALSDGMLGIALGDVSGKGIAAALMMVSLQASLRVEAPRAK